MIGTAPTKGDQALWGDPSDEGFNSSIAWLGLIVFILIGSSQAELFVVCPSGCNYSGIQAAVDAAAPGDIIQVQNGTYLECVTVTKQLALQGIGNPIVDSGSRGSAITLSADGITLDGFSLINSKPAFPWGWAGIKVVSSNNTIRDNIAADNENGILLVNSRNNTLLGNAVKDNDYGISLDDSNNNTLLENNASKNDYGILLDGPSDNIFVRNKVAENDYGILIEASNNNTLEASSLRSNKVSVHILDSANNNLLDNIATSGELGIYLESSTRNTLTRNNVSGNAEGIKLNFSADNTLRENLMAENRYNLLVTGQNITDFDNDIDKTNLVDNRSVFYLKDISDQIIDRSSNPGYVSCLNCTNVTVKDLTLTNNGEGISFIKTNSSRIENNTLENNQYGIILRYSHSNLIKTNNARNNLFGIVLNSSADNNLAYNNASYNRYGVHIFKSNYNNIINNIILYNENGILVQGSIKNKIYDNDISYNQVGRLYDYYGNNTFDNRSNRMIGNLKPEVRLLPPLNTSLPPEKAAGGTEISSKSTRSSWTDGETSEAPPEYYEEQVRLEQERLDQWYQKYWNSRPAGEVYFNPPKNMTLLEPYLIEALVPLNFSGNANIGLSRPGERYLLEKVGPYMAASLTGINFTIKPEGEIEQWIPEGRYAKWSWNVTPLREGPQTLILKMILIIPPKQGYEKQRRYNNDTLRHVTVLKKEIEIPVQEKAINVGKFINEYWPILTTIIPIIYAWIKRRKLRELLGRIR